MGKFKEYDVVMVKNQIESIAAGTTGVVLIADKGLDSCIVEFVDEDGNTIDTISVKDIDIILKKGD